MAEQTLIEWAHSTWSPWFGCINVSAACDNCYAMAMSRRNPSVFGVWGDEATGTRRVAVESAWAKVLGWQARAAQEGRRIRVFPSLCDPFEDWGGPMVNLVGDPIHCDGRGQFPIDGGLIPGDRRLTMDDVRRRFADLIRRTPNLDWLLLSKRPNNFAGMLPAMFEGGREAWPANFRLGTTVENQAAAEERLDHLLAVDWPNFVSFEPLLGWVDVHRWLVRRFVGGTRRRMIEWGIGGGESGPGSRPMYPDWPRRLSDQFEAAGVPFLFKQWGDWIPIGDDVKVANGVETRAQFPDGHDLPDLTGRGANGTEAVRVARVGKAKAGRTLDGVIHDGFPAGSEVAHA